MGYGKGNETKGQHQEALRREDGEDDDLEDADGGGIMILLYHEH